MVVATGKWSVDEIDGKRVDVFEPGQLSHTGPVVLYLQGYQEQPARNHQWYAAELDRHGLRSVSIDGSSGWWTDGLCAEFDPAISPIGFVRERVVRYIRHRFSTAAAAPLAVTGIGFGGQGALQLAYRDPRQFPVVAAMSPAIDFHNWYGRGLTLDNIYADRETARQATATLHLHPLNWPRHQLIACDPMDADWFEGAERLASKLFSSGIPFEADLQTTAGGDGQRYCESIAAAVIGFIAERLRQEFSGL